MRTAAVQTILDRPKVPSSRATGTVVVATGEPPRGQSSRRRHIVTISCLGIYLALGLLANLPVWLHGPSSMLVCGGCGDNGQEVWFLASTAHAIAHGQSPFFTNWINFPWGANLMDNTSMPLAGLIATPITLVFGPIVAYNVLFTLSFAGSAAAAFFAVRRYVSWGPAAFVGGLLYGFSPFMAGEGLGHLFLLLAPLPPLMFLCLDEIVVRQRHRWWAAGGVLGLLAGLQVFLSIEIFAIFALMATVGLALLVLVRAECLRSRWRHVAGALFAAFVVFVLMTAYPVYVMVLGPAHISGPTHPVKVVAGLATDLLGVVLPGGNQHFNFGLPATTNVWVHLVSRKGWVADLGENGGYVGLPLLLFLFAGVVRFRRDRFVRFAAAMAFIALVFSLGSTLQVAGHSLGVPLPFRLLTKLPFLQDEIASRYSIAVWFFVALLTGAILDRARQAWREWSSRHGEAGESSRHRSRMRRLVIATSGAWGVLLVLSLAPAWPYPWQQTLVPAWFTSPAVQAVPYGSTLLTYPMAHSPNTLADVWQAIDGMRYRIPAGQGAFAHPTISTTEQVFDICLAGKVPKLTAKLVAKMRKDMHTFKVSTVVVPLLIGYSGCGSSVMGAVLGSPATVQYGAYVWTGVQRLLARPLAAT